MTNAVSLTSPESLAFHLETRFSQLNVACELELWQEAFRSIEDLHALMSMAKKPPKPQLLANYYDKLARVFLVSENYTLHAYAWYKYYTLSKNQNKALSAEDLKQYVMAPLLSECIFLINAMGTSTRKMLIIIPLLFHDIRMASTVVVAALCIPMETGEVSEELGGAELDSSHREKVTRLASLLGPGTAPSRENLLSELNIRGITTSVVAELEDIYNLAEKRFQPLTYIENLKAKLDFIAAQPGLKHYVAPLQQNIFIRLLQQIARAYGTIKIEHVAQLAYFMDARVVERRVVEAVRAGYVRAKIDHQNKTLNFTSDPAGPDALRGQLMSLSRSLVEVANLIHPTREAERAEKKKELFAATLKSIGEEHTRILERRRIIERRKEIREQMANLRAAAAAAVARKAEEERRAVEAAARAEVLKQRAEEERKKKEEDLAKRREENKKRAEEKQRAEVEKRKQKEAEDRERIRKEKELADSRRKAEEDRREKERREKEKKEREEREKKERADREREEKERKEREEREKIERAVQEKRKRLEDERRKEEEKAKKLKDEETIQRLKAMMAGTLTTSAAVRPTTHMCVSCRWSCACRVVLC